ncbi:leucyl/phenylalanyl-tRNA--protein transferase [Herbivorax sp. ANBcel31]|uniref:leucyl/phenylalanyl-tRNA--protein transferase n=1 Tax=Herbivorax sp. ANBcel31 TaxID=3069754 RepID=UPI0027B2C9D9|nr:leucyl/phenylalanyl-tRNA--protein transferase [Herbivorax sp. ANBcel31]MDQ2087335.1 leucyl/phenylalanyl-tRNA--protein transferase [Herbivorax sp. ANBcel31]
MPIFQLTEDIIFPHPSLASEDGILAIGGDLSVERLLLAYENGIFPWFSEDDPIIWWSPDPRFVLFPQDIKISKSMKKFLRKNLYSVTFDTSFEEVISMCANLRIDNTWITSEIIESYVMLYKLGFAHSVEVWYENSLVGGLYGVSIGNCFFGESMFSKMDNASKTALILLCQELCKKNFQLIDCQIYSKHLESLGAVNISRDEFLNHLKYGLLHKTYTGNWSELFNV